MNNDSHEIWQVKVDDRFYEAQFEELVQWISEGALIPEDLVTHKNLRWLEAGKVPSLKSYFVAFAQGTKAEDKENFKEIYTHFQTDGLEDDTRPHPRVSRYATKFAEPNEEAESEENHQFCYLHPEKPSHYYCGICVQCFCKECPKTYGSVKLCPLCGGLCDLYQGQININTTVGAMNKPYKRAKTSEEVVEVPPEPGLSIKDLINSFKFPLKFPLSLLVGFLLFTIFGVGIGVLLTGEPVMYAIGFISLILTIMLQFGEFSKTLENLSQSDIQSSFIPQVNKYSFMEDFIQPFLMGGAVYLVSFGLFAIIACSTFAVIKLNFAEHLDTTEIEVRNKNNEITTALAKSGNDLQASQNNVEELVDKGKEMQIISNLGGNYLGDNEDLTKFVGLFMRLSVYYQMPLAFSFIFGILYFPIACAVAGSTRSIRKILNPVSGAKILKKLGFDYIKILCLFLTLIVLLAQAVVYLFWGFSNMNLPIIGIFSSIVVGTLLLSYFWVVFSGFLGISVSTKLIFEPEPSVGKSITMEFEWSGKA